MNSQSLDFDIDFLSLDFDIDLYIDFWECALWGGLYCAFCIGFCIFPDTETRGLISQHVLVCLFHVQEKSRFPFVYFRLNLNAFCYLQGLLCVFAWFLGCCICYKTEKDMSSLDTRTRKCQFS